jgi:hypothetical protein
VICARRGQAGNRVRGQGGAPFLGRWSRLRLCRRVLLPQGC